MRSLLAAMLTLLLGGSLGGCVPYLHQHALAPQPARLGAELNRNATWRQLPAPRERTVVAVYKFRDQTGQYKPQANGASFSTAVTQGTTTILIRALEESGWFSPIERENIGNLLNERKIIRSTREEFAQQTGRPQPNLQPLLFAGIILEGGIISYDANLITGGAGLRYFGAGGSGQYRQDRVTVYLRAISTNSGRVLRTVYTSKTILSQQVDAGVFQFVSFKHLLETETGFTYNEPSEMAVKDAIEKAVQALIYEGFSEKLWVPRDTTELHGPGRRAYLEEKESNLDVDVLGRRTEPRRPAFSLGLSGSLQRYYGDYRGGYTQAGGQLEARLRLSPGSSLLVQGGQMQLSDGAGGTVFAQPFNYLETGVQLRLLPDDAFTPFVQLGGGFTTRQRALGPEQPRMLPHALGTLGAEYLVSPHVGLLAAADVRYYLTDQLDGLTLGRYNDFVVGGRVGFTIYIGHPPSRAAPTSP